MKTLRKMNVTIDIPSRLYQGLMKDLEYFIKNKVQSLGESVEISGGGWTHADSNNIIEITLESDNTEMLFFAQGFCTGYIGALYFK